MIRQRLSGKPWLRRIAAAAMTLIVLAGAGVSGNASAAQNAFLIYSEEDEIELEATAWGRLDELRKGEHVKGLPKTGTKTLSLTAKGSAFPIVGSGTTFPIVTLRLFDSPGDDTVYRFTKVSRLTCNERSRVCSFDFGKVEYSEQ